MSTKIELTPLGSQEAQGCGDACGCGSAKAEPVAVVAQVADASSSVEATFDCRCGNSGEACCCADATCC